MSDNTFYTDKLEELVGGTITNTVIAPEDEEGQEFFGIQVRNVKGQDKILWILRDDEANGPGSFDIQEVNP